MNVVMISGNIVRDPEIRQAGNSEVAKFTVAVSNYFKKADGTKGKDTVFVSCEAWDTGGKTIAQYVKKGDKILVLGELKEDKWEDRTSGETKTRTKVRVSSFEHWSKRKEESGGEPQSTEPAPTPEQEPDEGQAAPF